ncbi:MAG TPA: WecB/TagA/CpsF family glycosyltransferase [Longimicrobiales bacterium]
MQPGSDTRRRANVLGVGVDAIDLPAAVERLLGAVDAGERGYVCVTGVHGVMEAQRDPEMMRILNGSLLTTPDGMPMVWVGRAQGHRRMARVYGPDLMLALCGRTAATGHTHFLYGGAPGVAEELERRLVARFPGLRIVGTYTPPFRPLSAAEEAELAARVAAVRPDFFWVGLSTPKQERFMARYQGRLETRIMLGVGAAFDMHSGRVKQAPRWMQRSGLEWFYRLCQEPRRLYRRYLTNNPKFVYLIALQAAGLLERPLGPAMPEAGRGGSA